MLQEYAHCSSPLCKPALRTSLFPSARSCPNGQSAVSRRAMKTTSNPSHDPPSARQISRKRRFDRLRHTAFPSFLPATKATRPPWPCCSSFSYTNIVRECAFKRFPCAKTRDTSVLDLIVANTRHPVFTRRDACGPLRDELSTRHGRPWWPCERGSHES